MKKTLIADIKGGRGRVYILKECLTLDGRTGSLKISPIRAEQAGLYELKITRGNETRREFFNIVIRGESLLSFSVMIITVLPYIHLFFFCR
ncbi:Erythroid membrane-associated protein [Labeo rohita]|uniref:Erythroid membrane-associated protein n=1 Tax=Labeo rohita TaxID=84645 RepID=A0ABQ8LLX4_LABRO|nr:Erythroid membrane-associated protein [Labeo rohita]